MSNDKSDKKIKTVRLENEDYPELLKEIYNPPKILYYIGRLQPKNHYLLSVVGTRKASNYGRQITSDLIEKIAARGIIIVSGLAYGIDSLAHQATLNAGGCTWAVLGSGLNKIYPAGNRQLALNIINRGGTIISEYPPDMPPLKQHFPARNRIISGLSCGTLIIEAPKKSGALITAYFALENNREVMAVPGGLYQACSEGTNELIKKGAKIITDINDVLELYHLENNQSARISSQPQPDNETENVILNILQSGPQTVDQISDKCKLEISIINSSLSVMEMSGKIKQIEPLTYALHF